jgi:hypothetical protein
VTDNVKSMSLLGGFLTIFTGVYMLNFNDGDLESAANLIGDSSSAGYELAGGGVGPRMSLQDYSPRSSRDTITATTTTTTTTTTRAGIRRSHSHAGAAVGSPGYMLQSRRDI